jgi:hypothetical protein
MQRVWRVLGGWHGQQLGHGATNVYTDLQCVREPYIRRGVCGVHRLQLPVVVPAAVRLELQAGHEDKVLARMKHQSASITSVYHDGGSSGWNSMQAADSQIVCWPLAARQLRCSVRSRVLLLLLAIKPLRSAKCKHPPCWRHDGFIAVLSTAPAAVRLAP